MVLFENQQQVEVRVESFERPVLVVLPACVARQVVAQGDFVHSQRV